MRHGFLLINKPVGPTSHDVVGIVRKRLSERKMGHLGTLDPAASGLLVLAVGGKALKVVELFNALEKSYEAKIRFGAVSSTYDSEGTIEEVPPRAGWTPPTIVEMRRVIEDRFTGVIEQVPPAFSAVKIGGERAYRKARQGRSVDMPSRTVEITDCEILSYEFPDLTLRITCGSGTYIRSLAHDLGQVIRSSAYLAALTRTKVGDWSVDDAASPDEATWTDIIALKDVLANHPRIDLTADEAEDLRCGRNIERTIEKDTFGWFDDLPIALLIPASDGTAHARKVL